MVKTSFLLAAMPLVNALYIPHKAAADILDIAPEELEDIRATFKVEVEHKPAPEVRHPPKFANGRLEHNNGARPHRNGPRPPHHRGPADIAPETLETMIREISISRHETLALHQAIGKDLVILKELKADASNEELRTWFLEKLENDLDAVHTLEEIISRTKEGIHFGAEAIYRETRILNMIKAKAIGDEDSASAATKEISKSELEDVLASHNIENEKKHDKEDSKHHSTASILSRVDRNLHHDLAGLLHVQEEVRMNFHLLGELEHHSDDEDLRQALVNKIDRETELVSRLTQRVGHNRVFVDKAVESLKSYTDALESIRDEVRSGEDKGASKLVSEFDVTAAHDSEQAPPCKKSKHGKGKHAKGKHVKGKHHSKGKQPSKKSAQNEQQQDEDDAVFVAPANAELVADQYIVIFKSGHDDNALNSHHSWVESIHEKDIVNAEDLGSLVGDIKHGILKTFRIGDSFRGYVGKFLPSTIEAIRKSPLVAAVEQDSIVHANSPSTEKGAPWGLARVSHREALTLGTFNKYLYDDEGGEGVTAYVVDTGIYTDHKDFEGRAKWGRTIPANDQDRDAHGHGTHCAGTIAGKKYGVAKRAKVVAVKVLGSDGSGTMSDVIGGIEWVVAQHNQNKGKRGHKGSTANMSLGGGKSPSLDLTVNAAVNAGVHFAVAAGNENQDACNVSPAGASNPITVGATNMGDARAYFSNWGKCVDIFAPGVQILSAGIDGPESSQAMSGTSMASPHICGLLTYVLSLQPESDSEFASKALTPTQLKKNLISFGTKNALSGLDEASPNVLAFNGAGESLDSLFVVDEQVEEHNSLLSKIEAELLEHGGDFISSLRDAAEAAVERIAGIREEIF